MISRAAGEWTLASGHGLPLRGIPEQAIAIGADDVVVASRAVLFIPTACAPVSGGPSSNQISARGPSTSSMPWYRSKRAGARCMGRHFLAGAVGDQRRMWDRFDKDIPYGTPRSGIPKPYRLARRPPAACLETLGRDPSIQVAVYFGGSDGRSVTNPAWRFHSGVWINDAHPEDALPRASGLRARRKTSPVSMAGPLWGVTSDRSLSAARDLVLVFRTSERVTNQGSTSLYLWSNQGAESNLFNFLHDIGRVADVP